MPKHHSINYVEFPSTDLTATKEFYSSVFGWEFQDWGEEYVSFSGAEVEGGFAFGEIAKKPSRDGVLVVLYSNDLEASQAAIVAAGGTICMDTIEFPGGKRFQFLDPSGNELGVWTEA